VMSTYMIQCLVELDINTQVNQKYL